MSRAIIYKAVSPSALLFLCLCAACTALPPPQEWLAEDESRPSERQPDPASVPPQELQEGVERLDWASALEIARRGSPTVGAAVERIRRAEARVEEAAALAYPRLEATASAVRFIEAAEFRGRTGTDVSDASTRTRFFTGRGSDIYNARLDLSYGIFDGGKAYYSRRAAESGREVFEQEAARVLSDLELRTSVAFLNVLLADGAIRIAEDSLLLTEEQEAQARARESAGVGLEVDTLRFATNASEERLAVNEARAERRTRLAVLAELLGLRLEDDVELIRPVDGLDVPQVDLVAIALAERPELEAIRAQVDEMGYKLAKEESRWWPDVELFASYGFLSLDEIRFDQRGDEFQVGGVLSMNLFEGGATVARTRALRHEVEELRKRRAELELQVAREVREAEAELEVARANVEVSQNTVTLADEVLVSISAQYEVGEAQVIDVTEATLQRTRAQLALLRSRVNLLVWQARLRQAIGYGILRRP